MQKPVSGLVEQGWWWGCDDEDDDAEEDEDDGTRDDEEDDEEEDEEEDLEAGFRASASWAAWIASILAVAVPGNMGLVAAVSTAPFTTTFRTTGDLEVAAGDFDGE